MALDSGPPVSIPLRWLDGPREKKDSKKTGRRRSSGRNSKRKSEEKTEADAEEAAVEQTPETEATEELVVKSAAAGSEPETGGEKTAEAPASLEPNPESPEGQSEEAQAVGEPSPPRVRKYESMQDLLLAEDELPDDSDDDSENQQDAKAAAAKELDSMAMDTPEVLDDESELRILPASRQPEEP
jgi:hypothetical protein